MLKAVPFPTVLSTRIRPRCSSMICLHAVSPNPVPPLPEASGPDLVVKKRSKIFGRTSLGIPAPLSRTVNTTESVFGSCLTMIRIVPFSLIAWRALVIKFRSNRCSWLADPRIIGTLANSFWTSMRYFCSSFSSRTRASLTVATKSIGSRLPVPGRANPRTKLVIFAPRFAASRIRDKAFSRVASSLCRMPSLA